jgi:opacity protein-like surface antigen
MSMKFIIGLVASLLLCAAPLAASASTDLIGFNTTTPGNTGIGVSTSVARIGPVQFSPAVIVQRSEQSYHVGVALIASVNVFRNYDFGVGVYERPIGGFALNSEHFQPGVSLGVRL